MQITVGEAGATSIKGTHIMGVITLNVGAQSSDTRGQMCVTACSVKY